MRSGQYGYSIEQFYDYEGPTTYDPKNFWGNTFEHALTLEMQVAKKFEKMPIEVHAQYRFTTIWERAIVNFEPGEQFTGKVKDFGPWKDPSSDHVLQVGLKVYF